MGLDANVLLNMVFGPTWDQVHGWDDVVPLERRELLSQLKREHAGCEKCPYLGEKGNMFFYCQVLSRNLNALCSYQLTETPTPNSAEYHAQLDHLQLQLWCFASREERENCINYQESQTNEVRADSIP